VQVEQVNTHGPSIFGRTFTRSDGRFDYVVHGGGPVELRFSATGMLPVQRTVQVEWGVGADVGEVALTTESATTTVVAFDDQWHVAQGEVVTDADGTRRPTVIIPPGTTATMHLDDFSEAPLPSGTLRMTEYTVGTRGLAAMPGTIPPNVAYTWAAEFRFDEAVAAGAQSVRFSQPVAIYVDNFLDFNVGESVPSGWLDPNQGEWFANDLGNGVVMAVMAAVDSGGGALLDLDGDADADAADATIATAQVITLEERIRLHTLYPSGAELWRFRVQHFSAWDANWGIVPPDDARAAAIGALTLSRATEHVTVCRGSVIECQNRTLGDDIPLPGTPLSLHYSSDRTPGRLNTIDIPIGEPGEGFPSLPASLIGITVHVDLPDRTVIDNIGGTAAELLHYHHRFTWDGLVNGRPVYGSVPVVVRIGYKFQALYGSVSRFGYNGSGTGSVISSTAIRTELVFWTAFRALVGGPDARAPGLGGWTLDAHHTYDPRTGNISRGGGGVESTAAAGNVTRSAVGRPEGSAAEGVAAADALVSPHSLAVGGDGRLWFAELYRVRRVTPSGTVVTVAGVEGDDSCGADNIPATSSPIGGLSRIALVGRDMLVISEASCHRVRYVDEGGIIRTLVGTGVAGYDGDGLPGEASRLWSPQGIARMGGSALLIADMGNRRIRRFDLSDRRLRTIVGNDDWTFPSASVVPAAARTLWGPDGVDVGPQGEVVFSDSLLNRVFRLGIDGRVETLAGTGTAGFSGDEGVATAAQLNTPRGVRVQRDGSVLVVDRGNQRVRQIRRDGRIATVVGFGANTGPGRWGRAATGLGLSPWIQDVAVSPAGSIFINDPTFGHVAEVLGGVAMEDGDNIIVPGVGGGELYVFRKSTGCHLRTLDSVSQQPRYTFVYGLGDCRPTGVVLGDPLDGNVVAIHRASATDVRVRGPFYATSGEEVQLTLNGGGFLESVTHGADVWHLLPDARGLLQSLSDPLGREHLFTYETDGRLRTDTSPAGVVTRLATDADEGTGVFTVRRVLGTASATGPEYVHTVRTLPDGARQYVDVSPGGDGSHTVTSTTTVQPDGREQTVVTSGSTTLSESATERTPDPRLGARAAYVSRATSTTAGRTLGGRHERSVTATMAVPPVPTMQVDDAYVNSETTPRMTTRYDATHTDCGGNARVLETTRGGREVRTCLDARGRVASVAELGASPTLHPVEFHYDSRGRMDEVTQGARRVVSTWRSDGRLDETAVGVVSGGVFTALQTAGAAYSATTRRPTSQSLPGGRTVGMSVDAMGQVGSLTPPGRTAHTMTYDADGRMESFTSPAPAAGGSVLTLGWMYNARRQLTRHTRADGGYVDLAYDNAATGHLDTVTFPALGAVSYGYRAATGAGETVSDPSGCRLRTVYESETLPTGVVLESAPGGTCPVRGTVSRTVNALFETTAMTVGDAPAVTFTLDADADRLVTGVGELALARDPATGRLTETSVGVVGTQVAYTAYGEPATHSATVGGATELGLGYSYDDLGRIETVTESGTVSRTTTYGYDSAGRLATVSRGGVVEESYAYAGSDGANGNRTGWTNGGGSYTATYDAQDRLTSSTLTGGATTTYGYDAHGSMSTRTVGGSTTTYAWDARGPLASVTRPWGAAVISYVLDPQGRRIGRRVGGTPERGWLYAGGLHPVAEVDADGTTVRRVFAYATRGHSPDLVVQREGSAWVTYRVLSDHLGSVRAVVRASDGTVMQRMDYDAFGRVVTETVASGWVPVPFGYAGGLYDRDTGLVRFGAREYDASLGRWVSRDPALFAGGDANLYRNNYGDPINFIDPSGRVPLPIIFAVGFAAGWAGAALGDAIYTYAHGPNPNSFEVHRIVDDFHRGRSSWSTTANELTTSRHAVNGWGPEWANNPAVAEAEHCATSADMAETFGRPLAVAAAIGYDTTKIFMGPASSLLSTDGSPPTPGSFSSMEIGIACAMSPPEPPLLISR